MYKLLFDLINRKDIHNIFLICAEMLEMRLILFTIIIVFVGCKNENQHFPAINADEIAVVLIDSLIQQSNNSFYKNSDSLPIVDNDLKQALSIAKSNNNQRKIADLYNLIGRRNRNMSEFSKAIWYFQQSIAIANKTGDDGL